MQRRKYRSTQNSDKSRQLFAQNKTYAMIFMNLWTTVRNCNVSLFLPKNDISFSTCWHSTVNVISVQYAIFLVFIRQTCSIYTQQLRTQRKKSKINTRWKLIILKTCEIPPPKYYRVCQSHAQYTPRYMRNVLTGPANKHIWKLTDLIRFNSLVWQC